MNRRTFLGGTLAVLALGLTGCGQDEPTSPTPAASGQAGSVTTPTLGLSYIPNVQFAPFYVGEKKGLFTAKGVTPKLRHHGAQEGLFTALAAGEEHYLIAGGDEMLQAKAQGTDVVALASYYRTYPVVVIVREDAGLADLAALKGKKIGLPGKYGESWYGLQVALDSAGLTQSDVEIVEIGYTQIAALTTKKVDAVVGYSNNELVQFGLAGVAVKALPLAEDVPLVSISLCTTQKYLDEHKDEAKKLADGMVAAMDATIADQPGAVEITKEYVKGLDQAKAETAAKATLEATVKLMTGPDGKAMGKLDPQQWTDMAAFMLAKKLIPSEVDASSVVTTDYVTT